MKSGRMVVPHSLKYQITKDFHSTKHWGMQNTYDEIKKYYYWPNMRNYIQEFCNSCDVCTRGKHPNIKPKAPLKPQDWSKYHPGQAIALDLATMTPSHDGFRYIMLITDGMSKFLELCPLRNLSADAVTKGVRRDWIARHGVPQVLLTDQGQQVDGAEMQDLCDKIEIEKALQSLSP